MKPLINRIFFIFAHFLLQKGALGDFGDYVDPTFDCPATTTCRQVCVASEAECPEAMRCSSNETLCPDGSCTLGECDPDVETPCAYECAPVACVKVVDNYDSCRSVYAEKYDAEATCGKQEEAAIPLASFGDPAFVGIYCWISIVTFLIFVWCAFNQRLVPVRGSSQPLHSTTEKDEASGFQTGYKVHPIGAFLHAMTIATVIGFHGLLLFLTIIYYAQQEAITLKKLPLQDEQQILKAFLITWMVGFVWCFCIKWPHSIHSLFLRRCQLDKATHVAICVPKAAAKNEVTYDVSHIGRLRSFFAGFSECVDTIMSFFFSELANHGRKAAGSDGVFQYCRVRTNSAGGRYFVFLFRRYNLIFPQEGDPKFTPGVLDVGITIGDISEAAGGLSAAEVEDRRNIVGPNVIEMQEPYFYMAAYNEFSKPFYTYQAFMVWSWTLLWYCKFFYCWIFGQVFRSVTEIDI